MSFVPSNRWSAFAAHIAISVLIFLVLGSVIYFFWYPGFLFESDGGTEGIKLIAGVDFLIGPFLTLCVYKLGKRGLRFDLTMIALLQTACLSYGMWTVWQTRPVALVYTMGSFRSISYQVFVDYGVSPDEVPLLQQRWPSWVAVKIGKEEIPPFKSPIDQFYFQNALNFHTERYAPFDDYWAVAQTEAQTKAKVLKDNESLADRLAPYGDDLLFFNLGCSNGTGYLIMDSQQQVKGAVLTMNRKTIYEYYLEQLQKLLVQGSHP